MLALYAQTEPHAAYTALTYGLHGSYSFILRTVPAPKDALAAVDNLISEVLLSALVGRDNLPTPELGLLQLPARLGAIGLPCLSAMAPTELSASQAMTNIQVEEICRQNIPHATPELKVVHEAMKMRNAWKS